MTKKRRKVNRNIGETSDNLDVLFKKFLEIKKAEGRAEKTINQYIENYRYFSEYLEKRNIPRLMSKMNKDVMRGYIVYMQNEIIKFEDHRFVLDKYKTVGLSPTTINTRLKTLRVMFKCLQDERLITKNPMDGVKNLRDQEKEIVVLSADELKRLLYSLNQRKYTEFRDYVLTMLLLDSMMRISEATGLKTTNFDYATRTVVVPAHAAKNRKARIIPIQEKTARLLRELIAENQTDFDSEYIFLTNNGSKMQPSHYRQRLTRYAERVGIQKKVHPHLIRHTAATMFLENGGDIRHLQKLLGHSDMRMVQRYTHLSNKALIEQHEKYSALNNVMSNLNKPRKIKRSNI
ncbi:tyrosine-type recombinase/integrase [Fervidibacillus halotolerans]|uniref:Tyrosine-type recombinase/integrase n=1 Tax=Fervidibacillus halotolerans TaxID=2980027 RepID=A0A9E8M1X1_9BACI|nr:tyrosine-type recombinase/integrase [Fervidibacillus halotolerans]WAA13385.1 tyrosine-type recombinase/integrase [Fervidibacillus halotolerans]